MAFISRALSLLSLSLHVPSLLIRTGKKQSRHFPAVYLYLLIALAESPLLYVVYGTNGFYSAAAYWTAWIAQGVVVLARWGAVCELCHTILSQFGGVWALTWRALFDFGSVGLFVSVLVGRH